MSKNEKTPKPNFTGPEREALLRAIDERVDTRSGRKYLSCADAFDIAGRTGVSKGDIGALCDEEGIRISGCQLGCFG